tara:strand:- start:110 stop:778 length:669 start_codon:yes stop_codon:yes gene_type:complete
MQIKFVKERFFPFLKALDKLEKEDKLNEIILNSLYYKQIKSNLIIKEIEHNKAEIENIVELESPRVIGMNESKKNMHLQKCVNTSVIDKQIDSWLSLADSIIEHSPQPQVVTQMREEKCTWRVEIAKLMISIGQDDLALEHLDAVQKDVPNTTFTAVDPKAFEENLEKIMKELKERIELRDSIGQKLQDNLESNTTRIAVVAVGLAAIAGMVWMVRRNRNRS